MIFHKAIRNFLIGAGLLTLSTHITLAGAQGSLYQPLVTFTIGPDFIQQGQEQTLSLLPPFQNHYTNSNNTTTVADAGVFIGIERIFSDKLWAQLGVSGYIDAQISPEGHVWLFASPQFDTLSYSYNIHHRRVMAEGKFLTTLGRYQALHPYVSWGLGAAFNRANDYQETPLIPDAIPAPPFGNKTQTSFTWDIGLGVDYNINPKVRLGAGYQFADLGSVSLGSTCAVTSQTLSIDHLYTNQLRLQLTILV